MEVGVRLIGLILRFLNFILAPIFWLRSRNKNRLPPLQNPLLLKSACEIAAAIRDGDVTSEYVVRTYIDRIKEVNQYLNAVVDERYRAALDDARAVDRQLAEARRQGTVAELAASKPLLGVPFTVKESCSLAGLSNAVGCLERAGSRAAADGAAVRRARAAGAVPLLVTNTPELCLGWETTNLLTGTTNNPYDLNCTPGGSSGGESALLASGASCFSVASDIAGSIRIPAAYCGVFGHKPTPGIIPIEGHIPTLADEMYPRFLTVGPMSRRAEDLPLLLRVMAGEKADCFNLDTPVDLKKLKVYYMLESTTSPAVLRVDPVIKEMLLKAVNYLENVCGATICEDKFPELDDSVEMSVSVFFSMKDIPNMLQDPNNPKVQKSVVAEALRGARSLQALGFALLARHRLFIPRRRAPHYAHLARRLARTLTETLGETGVLLYPACSGRAHAHGRVWARASGALYTMLFNVLGLPATAVPLPPPPHHAAPNSLPVALQVIAAPHQDRLCLAVAKELEKGFGGWKPPQ